MRDLRPGPDECERGRVDRRRPPEDVPVSHHCCGGIDRTGWQRTPERAGERGQRNRDHGNVATEPVRPVGDDDIHVRRGRVRRQHHAGADPPRGERPHDCAPVRRQVDQDTHAGPRVELLDEQVRGLAHPVLEHRAGQLDALTAVAVPGEARPTGLALEGGKDVRDCGRGHVHSVGRAACRTVSWNFTRQTATTSTAPLDG
jgi:hypothetical protein